MPYPRIEGDNLAYLYDRDLSTKNFPLVGNFYTSYGTKIKFNNKIAEYAGRNNYSVKRPMGINSMEAQVDLLFKGVSDAEAGIILASIQNQLTGQDSQTITLTNENRSAISSETPNVYFNLEYSQSVYNELSGWYIADYGDQQRENFLHDISVELRTSSNSPFLSKWGIYANTSGISEWTSGQAYATNDIVWMPIFNNVRDNFFYCTSGHSSNGGNAPTGEANPWTQSFVWEPDYAVRIGKESKKKGEETYKYGFYNKIKIDKNEGLLSFNMNFSNRSDAEARAILHFLENRMGYKKFDLYWNGIYRRHKMFSARTWEHEFVYYNVNNINVNVMEEAVPLNSRELNTSNFWNIGHE